MALHNQSQDAAPTGSGGTSATNSAATLPLPLPALLQPGSCLSSASANYDQSGAALTSLSRTTSSSPPPDLGGGGLEALLALATESSFAERAKFFSREAGGSGGGGAGGEGGRRLAGGRTSCRGRLRAPGTRPPCRLLGRRRRREHPPLVGRRVGEGRHLVTRGSNGGGRPRRMRARSGARTARRSIRTRRAAGGSASAGGGARMAPV